MQQMAQGWLVYRITDSPLMLGIVAFAAQAPAFFITPIAGLLSDRYDRRCIILAADIIQMIIAFILAILILAEVVQPWHIVLLSIITGIAGAFEMTTRHSFVPQMVDDKKDLGNAIALNSVMFNMARLIGPALAGGIVAWAGEGICFLLNGISFLAVIAALIKMNLKKRIHAEHKNPFKELKDGFKYVARSVPLRIIMLLMAFVSLTGAGMLVQLPVFARDILHGDSLTYGFLTGAVGFGALLGALYMASRRTVRGLSNIICIAIVVFGMGLVAVAFADSLFVAILFLMGTGTGTMMHMTSSNTIIQTVADDDKRGRAMSFYILSFSGFLPLGSLLSGMAVKVFGVRLVMASGGVLTCLAGIVYLLLLPRMRKYLRPVYIKKGIIPSDAGVEIQ